MSAKYCDDKLGNRLKPFLKWPGGKRWLATLLSDVLRREIRGIYYEPFVGAGAVFLKLYPPKAILSDINADLIETMKTVRNTPDKVIEKLSRLSNTTRCYYHLRSATPNTPVDRAARFIYLNRTCWGGLYRLNRKGEFNVPFGNSGRTVCPEVSLRACAKALRNAILESLDFEEIISQARKGDAIYADPPYTLRGKNNGFLRYNDKLFSWQDQKRLANVSKKAARRGVFVVISGIWHEDLFKLYRGWWAMEIHRKSLVSGTIKGRRNISELLLFSRRPKSFDMPVQRIGK